MLNKLKKRRKIGGKKVGEGTRMTACHKIAFSSSPSAGGREILIGSLNVNVNQNLSAE